MVQCCGWCAEHASMTGHALQIRQHYVYLLYTLDTKYSGILDQLFSVKVRMCGIKTPRITQVTKQQLGLPGELFSANMYV